MEHPRVSLIIPVFNEQEAIANVLSDLPRHLVHEIIVVDNGSTDETAQLAADAGARVIRENRRGYGSACLKGISVADKPDIIAFIDGDYSDHPEELSKVLEPILSGQAEFCVGSRVLGKPEPGALLARARFGNWLSTALISAFFGVDFTDLGPFRAIRASTLEKMDMQDTTFGWTVEMQVKAALMRVRIAEVPVSYRKRIGFSKITGTIEGTIKAGWKILFMILRQAARPLI
ncbi:MAG: glycosyltransferase family 2 protein [Candidatus Latescibacterota bacterium]|nr:glycosyltransferase family 2 protein [Candidatus Latescibacterota bacterium]